MPSDMTTYEVCKQHGRVNQDMDSLHDVYGQVAALAIGRMDQFSFKEWMICRNPSAFRALLGQVELVEVPCRSTDY